MVGTRKSNGGAPTGGKKGKSNQIEEEAEETAVEEVEESEEEEEMVTDEETNKETGPAEEDKPTDPCLAEEDKPTDQTDTKKPPADKNEEEKTEGNASYKDTMVIAIKNNGRLTLVEDPSQIPVMIARVMNTEGSTAVEVVTFANLSLFEAASKDEDQCKPTKGSESEKTAALVTPTKKVVAKNTKPSKPPAKSIVNLTGIGNDLPAIGSKKSAINPYLSSKKRGVETSDDDEKAALGSFAKKMKDNIKSAGMKAVVHLVENEPEFWKVRLALLDFINPKKAFTHWLHRPMKWEDVIGMFADDEEGMKRINLFLSYMTAVRFRDPAGNDIPETTTARGKNGSLTLYRDMFMIVLPKSLANKDIPGYIIQSFGPILNDTEIQSCYHMQYMASTENTAAGSMLSPIKSNAPGMNGKYWSMLKGALSENTEIVEHASLKKVLTSDDIVRALQIAGNVNVTAEEVKGKSIPEGLREYVYGVELN